MTAQAAKTDFSERNAPWAPTHRHKKGGYYRLLCYGTNEADRTMVAIYDDITGAVWVRNAAEFNDGRFDVLADPEGNF